MQGSENPPKHEGKLWPSSVKLFFHRSHRKQAVDLWSWDALILRRPRRTETSGDGMHGVLLRVTSDLAARKAKVKRRNLYPEDQARPIACASKANI